MCRSHLPVFNSRAIEDSAPVRQALRQLIRLLQADRNALVSLRRHADGLSLQNTNGDDQAVFVGPDLADRVLARLRVMANIDVLHAGLVHGQCELQLDSGPVVLSVRSNLTPMGNEVAFTLGEFGTEPLP